MNERPPSLPNDPESISLESAIKRLQQLRQRESKGADPAERSEYLRELIASGALAAWKQDETVDTKITIDSIGLSIHIDAPDSRGFHTHLPIEELTSEQVARIAEQKLLFKPERGHYDPSTMEYDKPISSSQCELALRVAEHEGDEETMAQMEALLLHECSEAIQIHPLYGDIYDYGTRSPLTYRRDRERTPPSDYNFVKDVMRRDADVMTRYAIASSHLPHTFVRRELLAAKESQPKWLGDFVRTLVNTAENLNRSMSESDKLNSVRRKYAWKNIKNSHQGAAVAKDVFNARNKEDQYSRQNYEAAKIIDSLLSVFSVEELEELGYDIDRSEHGKGASFLTFRNHEIEQLRGEDTPYLTYNRILLKPDKQLRTEHARETFTQVKTVARKDFEDYEALLLPHLVFRSLAFDVASDARRLGNYIDWDYKSDPDGETAEEEMLDHVKGILAIAITEFPEDEYDQIALQAKKLTTRSPEELQAFATLVVNLVFKYDKTFVGPMTDVVHEKLPEIKRTPITFGPEYATSLEQVFGDSPESFDRTTAELATSINIIETGGKQLPYAAEGRALRALGLQQRPGIVVTGGAKNLSIDNPDHATQAEHMADEILQAAIETKANVLIPGTMVGIGAVLAKKYQAYIQGLTEDERKDAPHFFAIEPGKNLYYPGNEDIDWESGSIFPVTGVDTIATPFHAGWSKSEDAETEQRRHNHYRQAIMNRISAGHGMVSVVANGGRWTLLENTEAAKEGFPIISLGDSGRVGSLLDHLATDSAIFDMKADEETALEYVLTYASALPDHDEYAQTLTLLQENKAFRDDFYTLIQNLKPGQLHSSTVNTLNESIKSALLAQQATNESNK